MPETAPASDILLLVAMPMELAPLVRAFGLVPSEAGFEGHLVIDGGPPRRIEARLTGIGAAAGEAARQWLKQLRPRLAVLAGFAGGLDASLRPGDWRLVREVLFDHRKEIALPAGADGVQLVTVSEPVVMPADKRSLGHQTGALMADMETYHIAEAARAVGVPLMVARAVSDAVDGRLPHDIGAWVSPSGRPRLGRVLWSMLRDPRNTWRACALRAGSRRAAKSLPIAVQAAIKASSLARDEM